MGGNPIGAQSSELRSCIFSYQTLTEDKNGIVIKQAQSFLNWQSDLPGEDFDVDIMYLSRIVSPRPQGWGGERRGNSIMHKKIKGPFRGSNPGPPAPEAGIIPLDQTDSCCTVG